MENCRVYENNAGGLTIWFCDLKKSVYIDQRRAPEWISDLNSTDWVDGYAVENPEWVTDTEIVDEPGNGIKLVAEITDDFIELNYCQMGNSACYYFGLREASK